MWPNFVVSGDLRREGHAFHPQIKWPDLRVVVDPATQLDQVTARYMQTLRGRPTGVRIFQEGTPDSAEFQTFHVPEDRHNGDGVVVLRQEHGTGMHGLFSLENNVESAYNWAAHFGLNPEEARARQIFLEVAIALSADVLITDNAYELVKPNRRSPFAATPAESLAVIGLHQRLQGQVVVSDAFLDGVLQTSQAEHAQAWSMMSALRDLFDRTYQEGPEFLDLVRACGDRLKRVLDLRDRLLFGSIHPSKSNLFGEPEVLVEQIALNLSGMLDALARALNTALQLGAAPNHCSLGNKRFTRRIPLAARAILLDPRNLKLIDLVAGIRNTIHHLDLGGGGEGDSRGRTTAQLVSVDKDTAEKVREVAAILGREDSWIAHDLPELSLMLRPVPLTEDLIEHCVAIVQHLAAVIDWPGEHEQRQQRPEEDPSDSARYGPTLEIIRRLYGLDPAANHSLH
ncbi:hypothetical protein E3O44_05965 [Cryobacterium algoricola]|uniref:Uncharacterized protein n=1 Tax=Cryobacterium algoricola TaxID=1259183 RepID=A0ABY2IGY0_9MICO|nr:hypothetical protein [Cryobacterium algoricola]TFB88218.1 hypothetical protein E3O44_05965 [Cryobacterium algoricola]